MSGAHFGRLDRGVDELAAAFPGWHIWTVRHAVSGTTTWCARRLPLIKAASAGELVVAIAGAEGRAVPLADTLSAEVPLEGRERLRTLDRLCAEVRSTFPNWHTTYTPRTTGAVEWESYRLPLLHASSAEDLATDIQVTEGSAVSRPENVTSLRPAE